MFYALHRVYLVGWAVLLIGGAVWAYPRSGISEPIADWYEVWLNARGAEPQSLTPIDGTVLRVTDGNSFVLRGTDRQIYSIGLAGLVAPSPALKSNAVLSAQSRRALLSELVLSNQVSVGVLSLDGYRRGLGVVHVGSTNVNAVLVESGAAELKRAFIRELPWWEQYALIRAERQARREKPEPEANEHR